MRQRPSTDHFSDTETAHRLDLPGTSLNGQNNHHHDDAPPVEATPWKRRVRVLLSLVAGAGIAGFAAWHFLGHARTPADAAKAGGNPAPVAVGVETAAAQKMRLWNDFSGRLRAVDSADIRPEVNGRITEVRFQDGQSVRAGDVLFVIDPRPYQAAVARAQARIASAKANLQFTKSEQTRVTGLLRNRVIAQAEFDKADSANNVAAADLQTAEAELRTAEVDLDHAFVKAPISGRVSRAELTVGNLVQSGAGAPLLTSVVSENSIYADFEVDEQTYLASIRDHANGNAEEKTIPVELTVSGDTGHVAYRGFIQNFDNRLNSDTGTIRARARFDNADRTLVPGMFASVRLASSREREVVLIADRAVSFDQSKKFVFVVSAPENKVTYREVELGSELGGRRVVLKGVAPGERIIVDGIQRVRAGATVIPQEVPATTASAANGKIIRVAQAGSPSSAQAGGNTP